MSEGAEVEVVTFHPVELDDRFEGLDYKDHKDRPSRFRSRGYQVHDRLRLPMV